MTERQDGDGLRNQILNLIPDIDVVPLDHAFGLLREIRARCLTTSSSSNGAEGAGALPVGHFAKKDGLHWQQILPGESSLKPIIPLYRAALPQPAPDGMRARVDAYRQQGGKLFSGFTVADDIEATLSAPVPSPDGAGEKGGFAFPKIAIDWATINAQQFETSRAHLLAKLTRFMSPESKEAAYWSDNHYTRSDMYVLHELLKAASVLSPATGAAEPVAHYHHPSTMHMGDCSVCGNISDHPLHIGSTKHTKTDDE